MRAGAAAILQAEVALEVGAQHDGLVVLQIARTEEQDRAAAANPIDERLDHLRLAVEIESVDQRGRFAQG